MNTFSNPNWINKNLFTFKKFKEIPNELFDEICLNLEGKLDSINPTVSLIITTYNEETNIVRCIYSISKSLSKLPFEIIVVDNNSNDDTLLAIEKLPVRLLKQKTQGCGPSRQLGQEHANGKYILLGDADCLYPPDWINSMMKKLNSEGVAVVYGDFSYLSSGAIQRFGFFIYERLRNLMMSLRHVNRPFLNVYGLNMGYKKECGMKAGFVMDNIRGNDGRIAFDMMKYGKIVWNRNKDAVIWTDHRTLLRDGNILQAIIKRVYIELTRSFNYFSKMKDHDTKKSKNPKSTLKNDNTSFIRNNIQ